MPPRDERVFFDQARIYVEAGAGGNGVVAFRREKFVPMGGPSGGHGGDGGDVLLVVNPRLNTLIPFRHRSHFKAERGEHGRGKEQHGANGADRVIEVPPGTVVHDGDTGAYIADLVLPDAQVVVARGGRGGRGNSAFVSSTNQAPRWAEKGQAGESRWLNLELRLVADVGIIGKPNAGKSTFLASVTAARPKIADYPFTTLIPNLGVAMVDDRGILLADIPGLIEGAHTGAGLGTQFLRHVARTRLLIHLLDGSAADPLADFDTINAELAQAEIGPDLARKPQIVGLNKMDLPEAQAAWPRVREALAARGTQALPLSAATGAGVRELLRAAAARLEELPIPAEPETEEVRVYTARDDDNAFEIVREGSAFRVRGPRVERLAQMTNWEQEEGVARAHRVLRAMGVTDALVQAGVKEGDYVRLGEVELEWRERI